jgi:hypothetical protein
VELSARHPVPHALYCDEAENFIGDFNSILAETRKYAFPDELGREEYRVPSAGSSGCHLHRLRGRDLFSRESTDAERLSKEFGAALLAAGRITSRHDVRSGGSVVGTEARE